MSLINIIGLVYLGVVLVVGTILKLITRKKLKEIDGFGEITVRDGKNENVIKI